MSIADWQDVMPHTVTYEAVSGRDDYGAPTYATAVTYAHSRVQYSQKRVASNVTGHDTLSFCQCWIPAALTGLSPDDRITLPDGSSPKIVGWEIRVDEAGNHHTKVAFGG